MTLTSTETRNQMTNLVREFVRRDVDPVVNYFEHEDIYPQDLVDKMAKMGLFGIMIPEEYGGLGLDYTTFALIFEELSRGWMSLTGPLGTHHILAYVISTYGTEEMKQRFSAQNVRGSYSGRPGADRTGRRKRYAESSDLRCQGR